MSSRIRMRRRIVPRLMAVSFTTDPGVACGA
jgi:hypothetical protein